MPYFDHDEIQLISFYAADTLAETLNNVKAMADFISEEEPELEQLTASVLFKLSRMSEEQIRELSGRIIPDILAELPADTEAEA